MKRIFSDLKIQILNDYKEIPLVLFLEMIGTFAALVSSFSMAYLGQVANLNYIFLFYITSSVTLLTAAFLRKNSFLIVLNSGFLICNSIYFIKHFISFLL